MMLFVLRILAIAIAVYLTANIIPGITLTGGYLTTLFVALIWAVIVAVIRPVLRILTLPVTIITFGLSSFIINALFFWGMQLIVLGFHVDGFLPALMGSVVLSIATWLISKILPN